ncbi:MAG TPA: S8 family serine peptidase [Rubrivivax sp.]|nr:S8 family serine peptidase [Rubrivivax sp.]
MRAGHRWLHRGAALAWAATLGAAPLAQAGEADGAVQARPVHGLIVRLQQPPAHERLQARSGAAAHEAQRWQRVLGQAGLSGTSGRREPRLHPVGRDQQWLEFDAPLSAREAAALRDKLLARPDVDWVEPNQREQRLQAAPDDPLYPQQWWLHAVSGSNANALPARLRGVAGFQSAWLLAGAAPAGAPTVVAVLDTGITPHPELDGRVLAGYDFVSTVEYANDGDGRDADASDPGDGVSTMDLSNRLFAGCTPGNSSWHGTIIAGMLAARSGNGAGGAGIHQGIAIVPVRVAGKCGAELRDIIDGMRWAAGLAVPGAPPNPNPARILNISFGGSAACGPAYQQAVDELRAHGVVVVAAAGNDWSAPSRPASCNGVVGVAGLNRDGFKANYSNFGAALQASGIATVSGDDADGNWGADLADSGLVTLTNRGSSAPGAAGYARFYGTSFAAPQVAGTLALMLSLNPGLSHAQLVQGLRASARPHVVSPKIAACAASNPGRCICTTATCGAGILDAEQALRYAAAPDSYVAPPRTAAVIDNADLDAALARAPQDRAQQPAAEAADSGGGGGAMGGLWLLALATASLTLRLLRLPPR